ncbi:MAG: hypothetical protein RL077_6138 [Verrucomicrobiota bacterium]|jgi:predicted nucleic acid-binding protein
MSYWDTSALVKLYALEPDSAAFENHLRTPAHSVVSSRVALWEAWATFRRKEAEGALAPGAAQLLQAELQTDLCTGEWRLVEAGNRVEAEFNRIVDLCYLRTPPLFIRTFDAIHLASARVAGETEIVASDKRLREAARVLGFALFPQ